MKYTLENPELMAHVGPSVLELVHRCAGYPAVSFIDITRADLSILQMHMQP